MALTTVRPQGMGFNTGRRNLIKNGAMQVAQRGTSITGVGIDDYSLDRWKQWASSGSETGRSTITQETITDLAGFSQAMKIQVTTADTSLGATDALAMMQRIEAQDILPLAIGSANSKALTLSVYAKAPTGNGTYCMGIAMPGGGHYVEEVTVGTSWSRHKINIPATTISSHATTATGTSNGMQAFMALCAGSSRNTATNGTWGSGANIIGTTNQTNFYSSTSNNLWLAGWQLEVGENASDFEHRSYGEELQLCSRFYQQITYDGGSAVAIGFQSSTSGAQAVVYYPYGLMRAAPTITLPSAGQGASLMTFLKKNTGYPTTTGSHAGEKANTAQYFLTATGYAGLDGGGLGTWLYTGSSSGSITFKYDAEL